MMIVRQAEGVPGIVIAVATGNDAEAYPATRRDNALGDLGRGTIPTDGDHIPPSLRRLQRKLLRVARLRREDQLAALVLLQLAFEPAPQRGSAFARRIEDDDRRPRGSSVGRRDGELGDRGDGLSHWRPLSCRVAHSLRSALDRPSPPGKAKIERSVQPKANGRKGASAPWRSM